MSSTRILWLALGDLVFFLVLVILLLISFGYTKAAQGPENPGASRQADTLIGSACSPTHPSVF